MPLDGAIDWATDHGFVEIEGVDGVAWTGQRGTEAAVAFTADGNVVTRTTVLPTADANDVPFLHEWLALAGGNGAPGDLDEVAELAMSSGIGTEHTIV